MKNKIRCHVTCVVIHLLLLLSSYADAVDLHFENPDSGFFLRPEGGSGSATTRGAADATVLETLADSGGVLDVERFTVLDATRPALIRATYGPFSTKQTVPVRYVMPQFPDEENITLTPGIFTGPQLEISAHLVTKKVTRGRPAIRVLLHGAGARGHHSPHVCVTVVVRRADWKIAGSCTPVGAGETGGDATCLVTLNVPSRWWPPHSITTVKIPRTVASVSYLVGTADGPDQCASFSQRQDDGVDYVLGVGPRVTVQPETPVGEVLLALEEGGYDEVSKDSLVQLLVPRAPLYPGSTMHAPVYLQATGNLPAIILVLRCRVKGGLRVAGVESASNAWNITVETNGSKRNRATVTAMLTDPAPENSTLHALGLHEVMSWVLEVPRDAVAAEARVTWTVQYVMDALRDEFYSNSENPRKISAKIVILKDDTQAVLPIAKSWSIVNTAVLTGRQVSRAMKVLIVSQAGRVADVTLQSSCSCTDEAALKVSSSCTSVYLDGSEVDGSHNATVIARYGQRTGSASFTVWMPELPLLLHVVDAKLSQMRGWKAPLARLPGHPYVAKATDGSSNDDSNCQIRYQQTEIQVYGRFYAVDNNSGRQSYLLSRSAQMRVTELVSHSLRVADNSVVQLSHTTLTGMTPGRTEVQVLSPITGRVIGSREIRVGSDKVWVTRLHAAVISGLTLALQPDTLLQDGFTAITAVTPVLTAKYQEGLIDVWIELSDGTLIPLRQFNPAHYWLRVRSLDPEIVAVAPSPRTAQPRVIAIGSGHGDLLQVDLEVAEECEEKRTVLSSTTVFVNVELSGGNPKDVNATQSSSAASTPSVDSAAPKKNSKNDTPDHNDKMSLKDELPHADAAASSFDHFTGVNMDPHRSTPHHYSKSHPAPLEVGMYVLLSIFGMAVVVFAASCIVYSWRGNVVRRPSSASSSNPMSANDAEESITESITNAHDWVWLGRATLERASGMGQPIGDNNSSSANLMPIHDFNENNQTHQNKGVTAYNKNKFSPSSDESAGTKTGETDPLISSATPVDTSFIQSPSGTAAPSRRVTFNNLNGHKKDEIERIIEGFFSSPPIPPHRSGGGAVNLMDDSDDPPPVPPHGINLISNPLSNQNNLANKKPKQNDVFNPPKFVEVNADDFVRLRGVTRTRAGQIRRATILENPLLSTKMNIPECEQNGYNPSHMMDYEQLVSYFSGLKESDA